MYSINTNIDEFFYINVGWEKKLYTTTDIIFYTRELCFFN